jgi:DNA-binding response OmpR family regulator
MDMNSPLVVLAEDSPADVYIVHRSLKKHLVDFELQIVDDGEKAIRLIDRTDAGDTERCPAIVILDLNLPRKSGREVLQHVRRSARCSAIPVIVLTSSDSLTDRTDATRLGATVYFCKPIDLEKFMEIGQIVKDTLAACSA